MSEHTPTPWFVSGVRFRMNGGEWHSVNRYDEALKRDENVACVGYDPRNGAGLADAHFIVKAVNSHDALVKALEDLVSVFEYCSEDPVDRGWAPVSDSIGDARRILAAVGGAPKP